MRFNEGDRVRIVAEYSNRTSPLDGMLATFEEMTNSSYYPYSVTVDGDTIAVAQIEKVAPEQTPLHHADISAWAEHYKVSMVAATRLIKILEDKNVKIDWSDD